MPKRLNLLTCSARQVEGYIRNYLREKLGDLIENQSQVYAHHGYYFVKLPGDELHSMRRGQVKASVKALLALSKVGKVGVEQ